MSKHKPSLRIFREITNITSEDMARTAEVARSLPAELGTMVADVTIYTKPEHLRVTLVSPRELRHYHRVLRLPLGRPEAFALAVHLDDLNNMGELDKARLAPQLGAHIVESQSGNTAALLGVDAVAVQERIRVQAMIDDYYGTEVLDSLIAWSYLEPGAGFMIAKTIRETGSPLVKTLASMATDGQLPIPNELALSPLFIEDSEV